MINKTNLRLYLVPAIIFLIIILVVLMIPFGNKKNSVQNVIPTSIPLPTGKKPTPLISKIPTNGPTPTLIPFRFTGGDLTKDIPPDVKLFSQQKTDLRKKTPLEQPFGTISFDYENDKFILTLKEPKDQSQTAFETWLQQTYSAIPTSQFSIN